MAPDQVLLQFLSILPGSKYEMKKRTCSTGQRLDRDQVLLMIRMRYDNVQRQQNKGVVEVPGRRGAVVPRKALEIWGSEQRWVWERGGNGGEKGGEKKDDQRQTSMPATETSTAVKEAAQGATVVARSATKRRDAPDRFVAFAAERAIRRKYAPTL